MLRGSAFVCAPAVAARARARIERGGSEDCRDSFHGMAPSQGRPRLHHLPSRRRRRRGTRRRRCGRRTGWRGSRPAARRSPPCSRKACGTRRSRPWRRRSGRRPSNGCAILKPFVPADFAVVNASFGPGELEVLRDRSGLAGIGQELRECRRMLATRSGCRASTFWSASAGDELRGSGLGVEVLRAGTRQPARSSHRRARRRSRSVLRGRSSAERPLTASPAPAAESMRRRRFMPGVCSLSLPVPQEQPG